MRSDPEKFEISLDGITYKVQRSTTDKNVYKLSNEHGTYLIAKDFYGIWVELTSKTGSANISLNQIGPNIEAYYKYADSL